MYFKIKNAIKPSRFLAGSQAAKHKDNSDVKNYQSQIEWVRSEWPNKCTT